MKWNHHWTIIQLLFVLVFGTPSKSLLAEDIDLGALITRQNLNLQQTQNSYWTQLFNQDLISTPQIENRVSNLLYEIDFLRSEAADLDPSLSLPPWPRIHPDVAARLSFYREKATELMQTQQSQATPLNLNFQSIRPAPPGLENRSHYPREGLTSRPEDQCTTGGFITSAVTPDRQGFDSNRSLLSDFSRWTDRECKTPTSVTLQLNGQVLQFSCNPGGSQDTNLNNGFSAMEMCDPMLFGFAPSVLPNGDVQSLCRFPDQTFIGRSATYSAPFMGPDTTRPSGHITFCEGMAEAQVPRAFRSPNSLGESDASLVLAARLAIENPRAFEQMKTRLDQFCNSINTSHPQHGHCQNLQARANEVERVMGLIRNPSQSPAEENSTSEI